MQSMDFCLQKIHNKNKSCYNEKKVGSKEMKSKSIQSKILKTVALISILVFSFVLFYLEFYAKPANEKNVLFLIRQNVETKAQEVNQWIEKRIVEYRTLAVIPAIRSMDTRLITPIINQVTNSYRLNDQTMETFSFIGKNGFCWINAEATEHLIRYDEYTSIYESDKEFLIGSPVINEENRRVVVFYYALNGYSGKKESLIASAVPLVRIEEIVNTIQLYQSKTWIIDADHQIITTDEDYLNQRWIDKQYLDEIDISSITTSSILDVQGRNGPAKLIISPISSYTDWVLMTLVEDRSVNQSIQTTIQGAVIILLLLLLLIFILGRYLSYSVLRPIKKLQLCMHEAQNGNLKAYYPVNLNKDEINELGIAYNQMIDELSDSFDQIINEQEQKRTAELKTLQEQIKPHFLYNTLDNIRWMAKRNNDQEVSEAITTLSSYFRLSLSNGNEFIPLKQEFQHTRYYLDIQKMRYKDKFSFLIQCDEAIEDLPITKIILQPLVENAINHGIKNSFKNGLVQITGSLKKDWIVLKVEDDGCGIESEKLEEIRALLHKSSGNHVGLKNVYDRLKNTYFDQFDMSIESRLQIGTKITIRIKKEALMKYVSNLSS